MEFSELVKRSDDFVKKIDKYQDVAVKNSEDKLITLNKNQMTKSILSTGKTIVPPYSPGYAKYKGFTNPNLEDTGDFKKAIFLSVQSGKYFISSTDWKTVLLIHKYSEFIFGIFNKSLAKEITTNELSELYIKNVL